MVRRATPTTSAALIPRLTTGLPREDYQATSPAFTLRSTGNIEEAVTREDATAFNGSLSANLRRLTLNRLESYNRQGWSRTSTYVPSIGTALLELPAGVSPTNRCVAGGFFAQVPTGVRINDQSYHFWHPMSINYTTQALAGFLIKVKMRRVPVSYIDLYRVGFLSVSTGSSARTISVRADAPRQN